MSDDNSTAPAVLAREAARLLRIDRGADVPATAQTVALAREAAILLRADIGDASTARRESAARAADATRKPWWQRLFGARG